MLKIGDFSRLSRVSVKALRYYDEIGLLRPVTVDRFTAYRYYSADQLPRLNRIVALKSLGLSLEEVAQLLEDNLSADRISQLLRVNRSEISQRLQDEQGRLEQVEQLLQKIEKEGTMPVYDVVIKKLASQKIASVRDTIPTYSDIGKLYDELFPYLGRKRVQFAGPPLAVYHDTEYKERDADVEAAVPVAGQVAETDRIKVRDLPGTEQAACLIHKGPYEKFNEAYAALMQWLDSNGYQPAGPNREIYLQGPGQGKPESYVTEIQLPVAKK